MKRLLLLNHLIWVLVLFSTETFPQDYTNENPDTTKRTQYRRGIELQDGYQSYKEKYAGKNLIEEKRRFFPLQSTGVWTELNPEVPRVTYVGIHFVNKDTGWAVGDLGALIKTTDGGSNWEVKETNVTIPIIKVRSYNGLVVIASGYDGLILRSTDGGETFEQVASGVGNGFDLWGLEMVNDTLGWACGATALLKTTDGGQDWQIVNTPGYTGNLWWIDFINESYGFIAADGKVLRTSDGGSNWEIIQAGDNQPLYCVDIIDSLHIAAAGYGGTDYPAKNIYSSDGGYTWINGGFLTTEEVNCVNYINQDTGYLVMNYEGLYKTTNRGASWTHLSGIGNYELNIFSEENIGYDVGTGLKLYKAEGNLDVWNRLIINDNFSDVFFVSEQKGFALSGFLYKTTDSGINWQRVSGAPGGSDIIFLDILTGFIGSNLIYKTTDGGVTWYVPNGGQGGAGKIFFINETTGWAVHSNVIYKTTDKGENWFTQFAAPLSISFSSIHFVDSLYGWTANLGGRPYKTTDGGTNWIQQTNLNIWESRDIYFRDSLNGFIINDILELLRTTNSGTDWFTQLSTQYIIRSFGWLSASHGFIVGDGVYETADSGNTWAEILELRNVGLRKFQSPINYIGYSTGYLGLIYNYLDTTIVPVELTSFQANTNNGIVTLNWSTSTESNNLGFEVLRSSDKQIWNSLVFINGCGTTTLIHNYQFTDHLEASDNYYYKLKQIDYNGDFSYSNIIEVNILNPFNFDLSQNYPNPFNPETKIDYRIPKESFVNISLFDVTGRKIKDLVNEKKQPGYYTVKLKGGELSSGIYLYRLATSSGYNAVKKLIIIK